MEVSYILEIIGTVAFALVGVLVGFEYELDIFGIFVVSICSALGGGVIRDVVLGATPPAMFTNYVYLVSVLVTVTVALVLVKIFDKRIGVKSIRTVKQFINFFDAVGLGIFTVTGCQAAGAAGYGGNVFLVIFVGACTAVGGGMIRDVLSGRKPVVLRKDLYAVISACGALVFFLLYTYTKINVSLASYIVAFGIIIVRIIAYRRHLNVKFVLANEELKKDD